MTASEEAKQSICREAVAGRRQNRVANSPELRERLEQRLRMGLRRAEAASAAQAGLTEVPLRASAIRNHHICQKESLPKWAIRR